MSSYFLHVDERLVSQFNSLHAAQKYAEILKERSELRIEYLSGSTVPVSSWRFDREVDDWVHSS